MRLSPFSRNKFGSKRCHADGFAFDSQKERARYHDLRILEKAGLIQNLKVHPVFVLVPGFSIGKKRVRSITYEADFSYSLVGTLVIEDVKGVKTEAWRIKWKLLQNLYQWELRNGGVRLEVT